jgi:hypothetical protein
LLPLLVLLIVASQIASTANPLIFDCCVALIVVAFVFILSSSLHPHLVVNIVPFVMSSNGPSAPFSAITAFAPILAAPLPLPSLSHCCQR